MWFWGFAFFSMPFQVCMIGNLVNDITQSLMFPFIELLEEEIIEKEIENE